MRKMESDEWYKWEQERRLLDFLIYGITERGEKNEHQERVF